jgi:outer membrane protein TolC
MRICLFRASVIAGVPLLVSAVELTAPEAIDLALRQNRDLAAREISLAASGIGFDSALDEFRWTVSPDGRAGSSQDGSSSRVGLSVRKKARLGTEVETSANYSDQGEDVEDRRSASVRVELRQPLLRNAGRRAQEEPLNLARSAVAAARRQLQLQRIDLVVRVVELHQNIVRLQGQLLSAEKSLTRSDQLYRLTRAREAQGRSTRVDTLRTEFQRGRAELEMSAARENLLSAQKDLADLLSLPTDTAIHAVAGPLMTVDLPDPREAESIALAHRLDYADALQTLRDARRGARVAAANLRPKIDLVMSYERLGDGPTFDEASSLDEDLWFIGLSGDTDLHRRAERHALRRAELDAAQSEIQTASLENTIRRQVQQSLLTYARAAQQVEFAGRNLRLATDRARLARRLFEIGRSDNFTVTDAESELLQAESEMLRSEAETNIAAYRLKRTTGTLLESPDDLRPAADAGASAAAALAPRAGEQASP